MLDVVVPDNIISLLELVMFMLIDNIFAVNLFSYVKCCTPVTVRTKDFLYQDNIHIYIYKKNDGRHKMKENSICSRTVRTGTTTFMAFDPFNLFSYGPCNLIIYPVGGI